MKIKESEYIANSCLSNKSIKANSSTLAIMVNNKRVNYQKDTSLLESLEDANIEVHYHCRDGFCGACRVKLTAGDISYPQGDPLAFVGDDEILTCCCIPITNISIEIDE